MPRRSGCRIRQALSVGDKVNRCESHVDGRAGRLPGARSDQGHGVVAEQAGERVNGMGDPRGKPGGKSWSGEEVRRHAGGAIALRVTGSVPVRPRRAQEFHKLLIMHTVYRLVGVRLRVDDGIPRVDQRLANYRQAISHLGSGGVSAEPDFTRGVVLKAYVTPHDGNCHGAARH